MKDIFCKYKKYILICLSVILIIPALLEFIVFKNRFSSIVSNDGWMSFFGSFFGGIIGGLLTLLGVWITIKNEYKLHEESVLKSKRFRLSFSEGEDTLLLTDHFETFDKYEVFGHGKWIENLNKYYSITAETKNKIKIDKRIFTERWKYLQIENLTDNTSYNSQITINYLKNDTEKSKDCIKLTLDIIVGKTQYLVPICLCDEFYTIKSIEIIGESEVGEILGECIIALDKGKIERKMDYGLDKSVLDCNSYIIVRTSMIKRFIEKKE